MTSELKKYRNKIKNHSERLKLNLTLIYIYMNGHHRIYSKENRFKLGTLSNEGSSNYDRMGWIVWQNHTLKSHYKTGQNCGK